MDDIFQLTDFNGFEPERIILNFISKGVDYHKTELGFPEDISIGKVAGDLAVIITPQLKRGTIEKLMTGSNRFARLLSEYL